MVPEPGYRETEFAEDVRGFPEKIYRSCPASAKAGPLNRHVLVDVIHDGYVMSKAISDKYCESDEFVQLFHSNFDSERDWGAHLVAEALAKSLRLREYYRVLLTRNILDFNRFPGVSEGWSEHLDRWAVSGALAGFIKENCAEEVLESYDRISSQLEAAIKKRLRAAKSVRESRFLKIAIHTYDEYGPEGRRRPEVGLIHRSKSMAEVGHLPRGVFSDLFPENLAAFSADRLLKSCLTTALEKRYIPEISDHPYMLPEGSVEIRTQVWLWFRYLRQCFEAHQRERATSLADQYPEGYEQFWRAVSNPNRIHPETRLLLTYLDWRTRARDVPRAEKRAGAKMGIDLEGARETHETVAEYLEKEIEKGGSSADDRGVLWKYKYDAYRPSCLVVEVRKDVIHWGEWKPQGSGLVFECLKPKMHVIREIGRALADGVKTYFRYQERKKKERARRGVLGWPERTRRPALRVKF